MANRNSQCPCGSGRRLKHCCGQETSSVERYSHISDAQILQAVHKADDEGLALGEEPKARAFSNLLRALNHFKIKTVIAGPGTPQIVHRIKSANARLLRTQDSAVGGIHLGAIMFRDMFSRFSVPVAFGAPKLNFYDFLDLSDYQKRWLGSDPQQLAVFEDQSVDLFDFAYGYLEFGHGRSIDPRGADLIYRSHIHLEAAAATATGAFDFRGTIQAALLGAELALKAALAAHGVTDKAMRDYSHNLPKSAKALHLLEPSFDLDRVLRVVSAFPAFVDSRYNGPQPSRRTTGHVLMGAQYVASEVTRLFSDRNLRRDNPGAKPRRYPA